MDDMEKSEMEEKETSVDGESKADRFKRLATKRVARAVKCNDLIGNLSSSQYEYTPDQVEKIIHTMSDHLNAVRARFEKRGKKTGDTFTL